MISRALPTELMSITSSMSIMMPEADQAVLARRDEIVAALRRIVPGVC